MRSRHVAFELLICLSDYQVVKQGVHVGCKSAESACSIELFICLSDYQVVKQGVHVGCMSAESACSVDLIICLSVYQVGETLLMHLKGMWCTYM